MPYQSPFIATNAAKPAAATPPVAAASPPRRVLWWVGASLALFAPLFAFLLTPWLFAGFDPASVVAARQLSQRLAEAGLEQAVRVTPGKNGDSGAIFLTGAVASDEELARVFRLADGLPFRVNVTGVRVENDLARAVRETLNARGFFPEVRYHDAEDRLLVALYLQDAIVEAEMMASLGEDVPRLKTAAFTTVYAQDVAPALTAELQKIGLDGEQAIYLAGKVMLPYRLDAEGRKNLEAALRRTQEKLGAPVFFQARAEAERERAKERHPADNPVLAQGRGNAPAADAWGGLKVMSVTLGAVPFVTTSDRQTFFPGATLPGGAILASIHADHLVIQNGRDTITHLLKEE
jgi:type III secretion system YscD/HrpQ family protein